MVGVAVGGRLRVYVAEATELFAYPLAVPMALMDSVPRT